jgi:DNA-binding beta-propeller fold protein YncE
MTLVLLGFVKLPEHTSGGFDHGDVHLPTGRVFVAHTANGTVEVIDPEGFRLGQTLPGCAEGSGVLCTRNDPRLVFAAARGAGNVLLIDPVRCEVLRRVEVGPRPNGLAWDPVHAQLLVADVETNDARLVDPRSGACITIQKLPGRPRWCVFDAPRQRFLVNVREPACVVALAAQTCEQAAQVGDLPTGPHGLDLDRRGNRAFVACDAGVVVVLDLTTDREIARVPIAGAPDAIWFNTSAQRLYVAIGQPGVVDVLDAHALAVVEKISTEKRAHTTAFDSQRQRLYVFLPESSRTAVYEETSSAAH